MDNKEIRKKWQLGHTKVRHVPADCYDVAAYTSKYMTKDVEKGESRYEANKKVFLRSRNLETDTVKISGSNVIGKLWPEIEARLEKDYNVIERKSFEGDASFLGRFRGVKLVSSFDKNWRCKANVLMEDLAPVVCYDDRPLWAR